MDLLQSHLTSLLHSTLNTLTANNNNDNDRAGHQATDNTNANANINTLVSTLVSKLTSTTTTLATDQGLPWLNTLVWRFTSSVTSLGSLGSLVASFVTNDTTTTFQAASHNTGNNGSGSGAGATLVSICIYLVAIFLSIKILGFVMSTILWWIRLALRLVFWSVVVGLGLWVWVRGVQGAVGDLAGVLAGGAGWNLEGLWGLGDAANDNAGRTEPHHAQAGRSRDKYVMRERDVPGWGERFR